MPMHMAAAAAKPSSPSPTDAIRNMDPSTPVGDVLPGLLADLLDAALARANDTDSRG